jgi:hypothetical protein
MKQIQQEQIIHEKDKYEIYLKLKEQARILRKTKAELASKDQMVTALQH